jgi:hypothetical protein
VGLRLKLQISLTALASQLVAIEKSQIQYDFRVAMNDRDTQKPNNFVNIIEYARSSPSGCTPGKPLAKSPRPLGIGLSPYFYATL